MKTNKRRYGEKYLMYLSHEGHGPLKVPTFESFTTSSLRSITYQHFHQPSHPFIYLHAFTFICPGFIELHLLQSAFIYLHLLSLPLLHLPSPVFICYISLHLASCNFICINLLLPSFVLVSLHFTSSHLIYFHEIQSSHYYFICPDLNSYALSTLFNFNCFHLLSSTFIYLHLISSARSCYHLTSFNFRVKLNDVGGCVGCESWVRGSWVGVSCVVVRVCYQLSITSAQ